MKILKNPIDVQELKKIAQLSFGDLVKDIVNKWIKK